MATEITLHDLKRDIEDLPASQRLILAGELVAKPQRGMADLGIQITANVVLEWQALKVLGAQ